MAMHARYSEVIQGTEMKPCSHPPGRAAQPAPGSWRSVWCPPSSSPHHRHHGSTQEDVPCFTGSPDRCILPPQPCSDTSLNPPPRHARMSISGQVGTRAPLAQLTRGGMLFSGCSSTPTSRTQEGRPRCFPKD